MKSWLSSIFLSILSVVGLGFWVRSRQLKKEREKNQQLEYQKDLEVQRKQNREEVRELRDKHDERRREVKDEVEDHVRAGRRDHFERQ